ncbi:MAG: cysteine desulfurase-like protein [Actinomycetales bacterium]|nr:cysteine desulfurase-like protein [Actinomycetales bacterium]
MTAEHTYDVERIRAMVPALADGVAYFDGPGGTQTPAAVAAAIAGALTSGLSNRGRVTAAERHADDITVAAREAGADLLNADPSGVIYGRSMTDLTFDMARTLAADWGPGDEIVVSRLDHDANVRPWVRYAEKSGATVRWAGFDPATGTMTVEDVTSLLGERTRLVALTGASNLIGTRPDLRSIGEQVHDAGALFYVDGVHLTAHASIDMQAIGADFYACSPYKFLGPHLGMVAASPALLETMHPDKLRPSTEAVPERFELGTLPYEMLAGVVAAVDVLADLVPGDVGTLTRRDRIVRSMQALEAHEDVLHRELRAGLASVPGIRLYCHAPHRTPTELFSIEGIASDEVYRHLAEMGVNAPAGSFYAIEAAEWLGIGEAGAVRVGLAPYTSAADVQRLIEGLGVLAQS